MEHDDARTILLALGEPTSEKRRADAIGAVIDLLIDTHQYSAEQAEQLAETEQNYAALVAIRDRLNVPADDRDPQTWVPAMKDRIGELLTLAAYQPAVRAAAVLAAFCDGPMSEDNLQRLHEYEGAVARFRRDCGLPLAGESSGPVAHG